MSKNISVFGIFPTRGRLETSISTLRDSGFRAVDISVLLPENCLIPSWVIPKPYMPGSLSLR